MNLDEVNISNKTDTSVVDVSTIATCKVAFQTESLPWLVLAKLSKDSIIVNI